MADPLVTVPAVLVSAAGILALYRFDRERRRRYFEARAAAAAEQGWLPHETNPWLVKTARHAVRKSVWGERMVTGPYRGHWICAMDISYTATSGRSAKIERCHLVSITLPVWLPRLTLEKDNEIARAAGVPDLELESNAFNDAFWVNCEDHRYASAVLHPRMMEWMLEHREVEWRLEGNALISWGRGRWEVAGVLERLDCLIGVIERLPPFVIADYGKPVS